VRLTALIRRALFGSEIAPTRFCEQLAVIMKDEDEVAHMVVDEKNLHTDEQIISIW
jgi:hypothetical protein